MPRLQHHLQYAVRVRFRAIRRLETRRLTALRRWKPHTTCVSEDQKYQRGLYKGPKVRLPVARSCLSSRSVASQGGRGGAPQSTRGGTYAGDARGGAARAWASPRSQGTGANTTPLGTPCRMSPFTSLPPDSKQIAAPAPPASKPAEAPADAPAPVSTEKEKKSKKRKSEVLEDAATSAADDVGFPSRCSQCTLMCAIEERQEEKEEGCRRREGGRQGAYIPGTAACSSSLCRTQRMLSH